jgi:hypothetical protein
VFSVPIVSGLTFLLYVVRVNTDVLFYLLFPGIAVSMLMTGGHGGSEVAGRVALVSGFLVNMCAYAGLILILSAFRNRINKPAAS